jgi:hypothetical protein
LKVEIRHVVMHVITFHIANSISLIVHWKHCNLLLLVELKYKVQTTTNLWQAKQQWTFISFQWIMLNYEMQSPKLNVVLHKAMNYTLGASMHKGDEMF